jgi:hypothetical protein
MVAPRNSSSHRRLNKHNMARMALRDLSIRSLPKCPKVSLRTRPKAPLVLVALLALVVPCSKKGKEDLSKVAVAAALSLA